MGAAVAHPASQQETSLLSWCCCDSRGKLLCLSSHASAITVLAPGADLAPGCATRSLGKALLTNWRACTSATLAGRPGDRQERSPSPWLAPRALAWASTCTPARRAPTQQRLSDARW